MLGGIAIKSLLMLVEKFYGIFVLDKQSSLLEIVELVKNAIPNSKKI